MNAPRYELASEDEMFVVGVDGCLGGWLVVKLTWEGHWDFKVSFYFSQVWEAYRDADMILVDIPIGILDDTHGRPCDWLARKILGPRYRSVFPVPCRPAIYAANYDEAIKINEKITGKRIFRATWNIMGKIKEVEELLLRIPKARETVREVHPEVCFWALAGGRPMEVNKKETAGFEERRKALRAAYPPSDKIIAEGLHWIQGKGVYPDDLLDALAAAVTGLISGGELKTLPETPGRDAHGLPMEMVYFIPGH